MKSNTIKNVVWDFLDRHQLKLEKMGKFVDWGYIIYMSKLAKDNIKVIPEKLRSKTLSEIQFILNKGSFLFYRNEWVKNKYRNPNLSFKTYYEIKKLKPAYFDYLKSPRQPFDRSKREINLEEYTEPLVNKALRLIENHRNKLKQLRFGDGYIQKNSNDLMKVYLNRNKYDYYGIIYKITEINSDKVLYGFTTENLDDRWQRYVNDALCGFNSQPIHLAIINTCDAGKDPDTVFKREVLEVHFNDKLMRKRENFWIIHDKTQDPTIGFNTNKGGGGGPTVYVSIVELIRGIAQGLGPRFIYKKLSVSSDSYITERIVDIRIRNYWGSLFNARKKYLKPILTALIKDGFSAGKIKEAFGNHGNNIVNRWIPKLFEGKNFTQVRSMMLMEMIKPLLKKELSIREISEVLEGFGYGEIKNLIAKKWKGIREARKDY